MHACVCVCVLARGISRVRVAPTGNKIDVDPDRRTVSEADAEAWCAEHSGIPHFLVSAKDGTNVEQAFLDVATRASTRVAEEEVYIPDSLDLKETSNNDNGNDCAC